MNTDLLPKGFLKKHPLANISAAKLTDFSIRFLMSDEVTDRIEQFVGPRIAPSRLDETDTEKALIAAMNTPEEIVAQMRKTNDMLIIPLICKKVLSMQEEAIPLILKRYKTTFQDQFVETAARILGNADRKYTLDLLEHYREIRNPYAQSIACLLFGEHRLEEAAVLLLSEYERFRTRFPDTSHAQGPLFALHLLFGDDSRERA